MKSACRFLLDTQLPPPLWMNRRLKHMRARRAVFLTVSEQPWATQVRVNEMLGSLLFPAWHDSRRLSPTERGGIRGSNGTRHGVLRTWNALLEASARPKFLWCLKKKKKCSFHKNNEIEMEIKSTEVSRERSAVGDARQRGFRKVCGNPQVCTVSDGSAVCVWLFSKVSSPPKNLSNLRPSSPTPAPLCMHIQDTHTLTLTHHIHTHTHTAEHTHTPYTLIHTEPLLVPHWYLHFNGV